jgi:hypothetical protein
MTWDWDDTWYASGLAAFVVFALVLITLMFAPKNVDYYYLSQAGSSHNTATCVYAHWTWHLDEVSFCTNDYQQALDFTAKANATLIKPAK